MTAAAAPKGAASSGAFNIPDDDPISAANDARESDPEDPGSQNAQAEKRRSSEKVSAFKSLGWLDRFLAVWILLAMIVGVLLGNFVPETGPALQKGKFVGVSVPIGECAFPGQSSARRSGRAPGDRPG